MPGIAAAARVVLDLQRLLGLSVPLHLATQGDPGLYAVGLRIGVNDLHRAVRRVDRVTLDRYYEFEAAAIGLAEKVAKGYRYLAELEQKLEAGTLKPDTQISDGLTVADKIRKAEVQMGDWERELARAEKGCLSAWTLYLEGQPKGRRELQRRNGQPVWLCARKIQAPRHVEVWTPDLICQALRVARTFDSDQLEELGPEEWVLRYARFDPLVEAEREKESRPRGAARLAAREEAGQLTALSVEPTETETKRKKKGSAASWTTT